VPKEKQKVPQMAKRKPEAIVECTDEAPNSPVKIRQTPRTPKRAPQANWTGGKRREIRQLKIMVSADAVEKITAISPVIIDSAAR
jgi:hypothetical protein